MRDSKLTTKYGIVSLHLTKGTLWVPCKNENYLDNYERPVPKILADFVVERRETMFFSENTMQSKKC